MKDAVALLVLEAFPWADPFTDCVFHEEANLSVINISPGIAIFVGGRPGEARWVRPVGSPKRPAIQDPEVILPGKADETEMIGTVSEWAAKIKECDWARDPVFHSATLVKAIICLNRPHLSILPDPKQETSVLVSPTFHAVLPAGPLFPVRKRFWHQGVFSFNALKNWKWQASIAENMGPRKAKRR